MKELDAMITALHHNGREVKKQGRGYVCLSPWTNEKTPSFHLYPSDGGWKYKCFSSGKQGDAIALLREFGATFDEACTATGQENKLNTTRTTALPFSRRRTRVKAPRYAKTSTPPPQFVELRPSRQSTFVPGHVYEGIRKADNIFVHFIAEHCSTDLAFKVDEQCICMGGDPRRVVVNGKGAVSFAYIDQAGRVARIKVVDYQIQPDERMIGGATIKRTSSVRHIHGQYGVTDSEPLLYGLPYVLDGDPCVYVVESEKTVELFRIKTCRSSIVATGGTLSVNALHAIKDRTIRLLPDLDKLDQWEQTAKELRARGLDVEVIKWWEGYSDRLGPKDDVGDLVQMLTRPECFDLVRAWSL